MLRRGIRLFLPAPVRQASARRAQVIAGLPVAFPRFVDASGRRFREQIDIGDPERGCLAEPGPCHD